MQPAKSTDAKLLSSITRKADVRTWLSFCPIRPLVSPIFAVKYLTLPAPMRHFPLLKDTMISSVAIIKSFTFIKLVPIGAEALRSNLVFYILPSVLSELAKCSKIGLVAILNLFHLF